MFRFPTQQQNMKTLLEIQEEQRKLEEEKQRKQQQTQAKVNREYLLVKACIIVWRLKKKYISYTKYS